MRKLSAQRGVSLSVLACGAIAALIIVAGLMTDGAAQLQARQRAGDVAAQVARYALDAAAPYQVDGRDGRPVALAAAWAAAARHPDLDFEIVMDAAGALHVSTRQAVPTLFLQIIGVRYLTASGQATAVVYQPH